VSDEEERVPIIAGDYAFITVKTDGVIKKITMLVMGDFKTKAIFAAVVPQKGSGDGAVVKRIVKWLNNLGHRKIIYKSDQENAMTEIWRKVKEDQTVECKEMVPEESPKGDSQSNGFIERCVREVKGMIRTGQSALEERIGTVIDIESETMQWLVEYAGCLLSRYKVGTDGQTPYERIKAKKLKRPIVEFGERVLFMPNVAKGSKTGSGDHEARYVYGVWLGIAQRSNEALIGNSTGVHPSSSIRRLAIDERWSADAIRQVKATPWNYDAPKTQERTGETRRWEVECEREEDVVVETRRHQKPLVEGVAEQIPRRVMIRKDYELRDHGYTAGCPGCEALRLGKGQRSHTDECRNRIEDEMTKKDEAAKRRVETANEKIGDVEAKRSRREEVSPNADGKDEGAQREKDDIVMDDEGTGSASSGLTSQDREWARGMADAIVPNVRTDKRDAGDEDEMDWEAKAKRRRLLAEDSDGLMAMRWKSM